MHPDPLRSLADYELFLYSLPEAFPSIQRSSLVLVRRGASLARVAGEIHFAQQVRLLVRERLQGVSSPVPGFGIAVAGCPDA